MRVSCRVIPSHSETAALTQRAAAQQPKARASDQNARRRGASSGKRCRSSCSRSRRWTVAIITDSTRRLSTCLPRRVLRMMMKGAAKTRNGTAAKVFGATPSCKQTEAGGPPCDRLVSAHERSRERETDADRNNVLGASGVIGTVRPYATPEPSCDKECRLTLHYP